MLMVVLGFNVGFISKVVLGFNVGFISKVVLKSVK
jgi:hypothetical protein